VLWCGGIEADGKTVLNEVLFLSFLAATLVIMVTPGPSVALVTSQAIRYGPKIALRTLAGDAAGTTIHIVIATVGLQFLISAASYILPWMQVLGGGYLLFLAYQGFVETDHGDQSEPSKSDSVSAFLSGFIACVSNPKAIIFFVALFPGFIDPTLNVVFQAAVYGVTFIILDGLSIIMYAAATVYLFKSSVLSGINHHKLGAIGMLLIGFLLCVKGVIEVATIITASTQ
jgi:homoserine/homoserine lactone efflux protein